MRPRAIGGLEPDDEEQRELVELWHLSRTALAGDTDQLTRSARIRWICAAFCKAHPDIAFKWVYVWTVDNVGLLVHP